MNVRPARLAMMMVSRSSCFCKGVLSASVSFRRLAMWPISVPMPVVVTIISARPRVTAVFMYAMQWRSPSGASALAMVSVSLGEATLSPVNAASSISSVAVTNNRPSAGTRLPASINTMSPGTIPSASISTAWPSRRTRAMFFIIFSNAARLASALDSWRRPMTALKTVSPRSTRVVFHSPVKSWLMTAAPTRMICMKSRYWPRKVFQPGSLALPASWLGPYFCRRCCASDELRPLAGSTFSCCATASGARVYHAVCCPFGSGITSSS